MSADLERRDRRAEDHVDPITPAVSRLIFRTDPEWRTMDYRIVGICPVDHVVITMNMPITQEASQHNGFTIPTAAKMLEGFAEAWKQHSLERHR